jgi:hypothetical protein
MAPGLTSTTRNMDQMVRRRGTAKNPTYSQIIDNDSRAFLTDNLLSYTPYLLAFHIADMATYDGMHSPDE